MLKILLGQTACCSVAPDVNWTGLACEIFPSSKGLKSAPSNDKHLNKKDIIFKGKGFHYEKKKKENKGEGCVRYTLTTKTVLELQLVSKYQNN